MVIEDASHLMQIVQSPLAKASPDHHNSTSMFHWWCQAGIYHLFVNSVSDLCTVLCVLNLQHNRCLGVFTVCTVQYLTKVVQGRKSGKQAAGSWAPKAYWTMEHWKKVAWSDEWHSSSFTSCGQMGAGALFIFRGEMASGCAIGIWSVEAPPHSLSGTSWCQT